MSRAPRDHRVVLVDDHALFAESLELALGLAGYDVERLAPESRQSLSSLTSALLRKNPRTVLLDLDLGHLGDSSAMITPLVSAGVDVVVVTANQDRSWWGACVHRGARTVIPKSAPLRDIVSVVRRLHANQPVLGVAERQELLATWQRDHVRQRQARDLFERLSKREREVLGELMAGRNVREIAVGATVSELTVRTQVKSILAKLEVTSQLAAVGLAHDVGWHHDPSINPR